jgi:DnaJ-class molecular chaperone
MVLDTTLYDRLEISTNATDGEIKKAFNKLSKLWHPDKHPNVENKDSITKKFQEINEAKEILLNSEKRKLYDNIGMDIFNMDSQSQNSDFNMFNPFSNFSPFFQSKGQKDNYENINNVLNVTLEQIYNEQTIDFTYQQNIICNTCNGEGTQDGQPNICNVCNGKGVHIQVIRIGPMIQQSVANCQTCQATGKVKNENNICKMCKGSCFINKQKTIQIPLKSGLTHNNKISLTGKGNHYKNKKSDLIITINELEHPVFKRFENDLLIEIELKLYQALFGFEKVITHLDGRKIKLSYLNQTNINTIRKLENEGMKYLQSNNKGNLYIKFNINIPSIAPLIDNVKNPLKDLLQIIDKTEFETEHKIKQENIPCNKLFECSVEDVNKVNTCFLNNKTNQYEDEHEHEYHRPNNECRQS